ncbi:TIGR02646 family protein [Archangium violaceum]|uniref:retron system putative HNH endonuclease n=1 Tax=Archangium violaceum TaxID=83451 RepID=UPI002B2FC83A|nr:TIGR02646 family protein [Archangium violaceum]
MRYIRKSAEPQSLLQHRLTPYATYANLQQKVKDEIREQLVEDQGFLCCYCMQRITPESDRMKIEHWASQSDPATRHRELDWKNLLGACCGNEGKPKRDQHCDTHKGELAITINPTEARCEQLVRFLGDGTIESDDPTINTDLNGTLNLNQALLRNNRKATLSAFVDAMTRKYSGAWPQAALQKELAELHQPDAGGMLRPYCQVPIFWLKKRMGLLNKVSP